MAAAMRRERAREAERNRLVKEIEERDILAQRDKMRDDIMRRGEAKHFKMHSLKERIEAAKEEDILRTREAQNLAHQKAVQTQKLAEEMLRVKNEEILEQKRRQVLRAQSIELQQLEAKLRSTYAAKAAQVQLLEREAARENEKYRSKQQARSIGNWYQDDSLEKIQLREALEKKEKYRRDLQDQMVNNYLQRQQQSEEAQRERKLVEEVDQVLAAENRRLLEEKRATRDRLRAEMNAFLRAREIWRDKRKEALKDEFDRRARIVTEKEAEEKKRLEAKAQKDTSREAMMEKMSRKALAEECRKREREEIVDTLYAEEQRHEAMTKLMNEKKERERVKTELWEDKARNEKLVEEHKRRNLEADAAFARILAEEQQKALRKDEEEADARRQKAAKYGRDVRAVMTEERARYAEDILERQAVARRDAELEAERRKEISEERSRMLDEHAPRLMDFLEPGILRAESYE